MVKTIVFGDTHACPQALEAILTSGVKMGAERFISLGDIFGYGPSPIRRPGEDPDEKKKGCLELLEGRFYEKRVSKDGSVSYILIPNRHLLLGNHDYMVLTGKRPPYIDDDAKAGVKWVWEQIGIDEPVAPGEARKELDGIHKFTKRPKIERHWAKQKTYGWILDIISRSRKVIPPEERIEIEENTSIDEAEKIEKYRRLKKQEDKFKPYHDLLNLWDIELIDEKLMFAHSFPPKLAKHAAELGIEKSAIDLLEVYIVSRAEWADYAADNYGVDRDALKVLEAYVKGKSQNLDLGLSSGETEKLVGERRRYAIAEEVVELLPEGFTLFVGHYHKDLIIKGKDGRQLFRPGPGFKPRAKPGEDGYDGANFVFFDSDDLTTIENGFYRIKYDRAEVDQEMETAKMEAVENVR